MNRLPWFIAGAAALGWYQAYAASTHNVPQITHVVHAIRLHFVPPCPACGVKTLGSRRPIRRAWHTAPPR